MDSAIEPNSQMLALLLAAYQPCANFGTCREAKWDPARGHIPRGFLGATGDLRDVEVVMVVSEPGQPHLDEAYDPALSPRELLMCGLRHTYSCLKDSKDLFHKNVRGFMQRLWPDLDFDEELRHVWLTEGRLCSIEKEIGSTRDTICATTFLKKQLELLAHASVVAFGRKAQFYLRGLNVAHIEATALAPPAANSSSARLSWNQAITRIEDRRPRKA
jgi:hypothetical protein